MERTAQEAAKKKFSPEFMNRLDKVVVFHPLREEQLEQILEIELGMVQQRVLDTGRGQFLFRVTPAGAEIPAAGRDGHQVRRAAPEAGDREVRGVSAGEPAGDRANSLRRHAGRRLGRQVRSSFVSKGRRRRGGPGADQERLAVRPRRWLRRQAGKWSKLPRQSSCAKRKPPRRCRRELLLGGFRPRRSIRSRSIEFERIFRGRPGGMGRPFCLRATCESTLTFGLSRSRWLNCVA